MDYRRVTFLTLSLLGLSNAALAVSDMQVRNIESRLDVLERRRGGGMINPPASPPVKNGKGLGLFIEGIYWKPAIVSEPYAITLSGTDKSEKTIKNNRYKWAPGLRAGLVWNTPYDGWTMSGEYTYLKSNNEPLENTSGFFNMMDDSSNKEYTQVKVGAKLRSYLLDLTPFDREFFVSKQMTLRVFLGGRGVRISQNFNAEYENATLKTTDETESYFYALGSRAGLATQWGLSSGWSFFGTHGISLLQVDLDTTRTVKDKDGKVLSLTKGIPSNICVMLDSICGIRYDRLYCNGEFRLRFQAGWDQQKIMEFPGRRLDQLTGLSFSGVSLKVQLDF
jgi:hypothetical protein